MSEPLRPQSCHGRPLMHGHEHHETQSGAPRNSAVSSAGQHTARVAGERAAANESWETHTVTPAARTKHITSTSIFASSTPAWAASSSDTASRSVALSTITALQPNSRLHSGTAAPLAYTSVPRPLLKTRRPPRCASLRKLTRAYAAKSDDAEHSTPGAGADSQSALQPAPRPVLRTALQPASGGASAGGVPMPMPLSSSAR